MWGRWGGGGRAAGWGEATRNRAGLGNSAALNYASACAHLLAGAGGLPFPCTPAKQLSLRSCCCWGVRGDVGGSRGQRGPTVMQALAGTSLQNQSPAPPTGAGSSCAPSSYVPLLCSFPAGLQGLSLIFPSVVVLGYFSWK